MKKDSSTYAAERFGWAKNDCVVRALAVASGCGYSVASVLLSSAGRRLKNGTPISVSRVVLEQWLKLPIIEVTEMPLAVFCAMYPKGSFVVFKRRHAFAVVDGTVHDWEGEGTNARTRCECAWEITEQAKGKMARIAKVLE